MPGFGETRETTHTARTVTNQNEFFFKVGSGVNHFNVSLIMRSKERCPQTTTVEEKGEPKRNGASS